MHIVVRRIWHNGKNAIGELSIDGLFECYTLEDKEREIPGIAVSVWKVPGETAIPLGGYEVQITMSARFKRLLPLLINVPGFEGVRIHPGNTEADTHGCVLVGEALVFGPDNRPESISLSRKAFDKLFAKMQAAERIWLEVT